MIKIAFAGNWRETTKELSDFYKKQTPNASGIWNNIVCVDSWEEADYVIVMDGVNAGRIPPKDKVVFFGREPRHVNYRRWEDCKLSFHHADGDCWLASTWWVNVPFVELERMGVDIPKQKPLSIIDSGRKAIVGHNNRVSVIERIVNKYKEDVDVWGKITNGKSNTLPYKTTLPKKDKKNGLLPYRYNLAIENGSADFYFSEKFIDPVLCGAMPIYWGCKRIDKFFPKGSYIWVDIEKSGVEDEVIKISKSTLREENIEALKEAKDLILNKYNLWATIETAVSIGKFDI
jgi:hypothetical protein